MNEVTFPLATELNFHKFLRHEPRAIAYTAEVVRPRLWELHQEMGSPDIRVTRGELLQALSGTFAPYLKSEKKDEFDIEQVTAGRLDQALEFMKKIDFITIKKAERGKEKDDLIITSRTKAPHVTNFKQYFIDKEAELRFEALEKARKKEERALQKERDRQEKERQEQERKASGQTSLFDYPRTDQK